MTCLRLRITGPDGATLERDVSVAEGVLVGSGPAATVKLEGHGVSALHCLLKAEGETVTVIDLGSATGTHRGADLVRTPTLLRPGDVLRVGDRRLEVRVVVEPEAPHPSSDAVDLLPGPTRAVPTADLGALEWALFWGDTLLEVRRPGEGPIHAGVAHADLALDTVLGSLRGRRCELRPPATAQARVQRGAGAVEVATGPFELAPGDRAQLRVGALSFVARWVPVEGSTARVPADYRFAKVLTTSALAGLTVLGAFLLTDKSAEALSEDIFRRTPGYTVTAKTTERARERIALALPKPRVAKAEDRYSRARDDSAKTARVNPLKREDDQRKVARAGLLGLLGGPDGSRSNVFSSSGLGTSLNQMLGQMRNTTSVADAGGIGGMGSRGVGPGGPGGLGLGGLGTRPGGRGHGGPDFSFSGDRPLKKETTVLPPRTVVTGSCERAVIGKVIARHASEIRFCYETELNKDPTLAGKIALSFTIDPTGAVSEASVVQTTLNSSAVEQCLLHRVQRWRFPEPRGGGVCVINYPWVFRAAGSEEEEP